MAPFVFNLAGWLLSDIIPFPLETDACEAPLWSLKVELPSSRAGQARWAALSAPWSSRCWVEALGSNPIRFCRDPQCPVSHCSLRLRMLIESFG